MSTIPSTHKAIVIKSFGGPEALELVLDAPTPSLKDLEADEILVKNVFAGVNYIDIKVRRGDFPWALPLADGMEGSGTVVAAGSEAAKDFAIGSKVAYMAMKSQSSAEYALVKTSVATPVPEGLDFEAAAASMMQGMTTHYLVESSFQVKAGDWVLVHSGAGGMGQLLTQICKAKGAHVVTTVSSAAKVALSKANGAELAVRYAKNDGSATDEWVEEARKATPNGAGFNVIYDAVGADTFAHSLSLAAMRGYVVLYGATSGAPEPLAPLSLGAKSLTVTRPTLFHFVDTKEEFRKRAADVFDWVQKGHMKFSYTKYPLEQVAQAHKDIEARKTTGKILLEV